MTCDGCGCSESKPRMAFGKTQNLCETCYYFALDGMDDGDIPEGVQFYNEEE